MSSSRLPAPTAALLDLALAALATLPAGTAWSWGGGTALAIHLDHRFSADIDIFLRNTDALRLLSPQRNPAVRAISDRWQEPGHYLKLERPEGEIDFIAAHLLTLPGTAPWPYRGHALPLETAAEVLAKKLRWRGSRALARDIFDLAATAAIAPESFATAIAAEPDAARRVADHIRRHTPRLAREWPLAVRPTETGRRFLDLDLLDLAAALDR